MKVIIFDPKHLNCGPSNINARVKSKGQTIRHEENLISGQTDRTNLCSIRCIISSYSWKACEVRSSPVGSFLPCRLREEAERWVFEAQNDVTDCPNSPHRRLIDNHGNQCMTQKLSAFPPFLRISKGGERRHNARISFQKTSRYELC